MSYEPTEERIERLEHQIYTLIRVVAAMAEAMKTGHETTIKGFALVTDQQTQLAKSNLTSLKFVVENSSGFAEPFRSVTLAAITEEQKRADALPNLIAEVGKMLKPNIVLPEDLFWPPKNPPPAS
jgi:hypothetical protein